MKTRRIDECILAAASLLAPGEARAEWVAEWKSELWYVPRQAAFRFCLGAFRDALWLRRNTARFQRPLLESPLVCLALLAVCAALSCLIAAAVPGRLLWKHTPLGARDLAIACLPMGIYSCVFLTIMRLVSHGSTAPAHPVRMRHKLQAALFLLLKLALLQPVLLVGFAIEIALGRMPAIPLAVCAFWIFALRWALLDQRRRCPVCLRLLGEPVRIGAASQTFLDWYGAESVCSRGHGILQTPEIPSSYSGSPLWLDLDDSWSGLFPASGVRH